ncbi:MAG: hypothetical protein K2X76_05110 [Sphingomonas sp.]|nr:hypothetical protein [Sphingomonas sp.]
MNWTEERQDELRQLWDQGLTASQIAERIGRGLTRASVTAKARRLGLAERGSPLQTKAKLEAMRDLIADAPLNQPLGVYEAARRVGLDRDVARERWRALCERMGEPGCAASVAFGDALVRPL